MARDYGDEQVLCVARPVIFPDGAWHGLITSGVDRLLAVIRRWSEFRPRAMVEGDAAWQQIVPYCVVEHSDGTFLLTRRLQAGSEERLHDRYSLGVGGHVNPCDEDHGDPLIGGLVREWEEEIWCPSPASARLVALINDDSNPVSQVHLGLVFIVRPAHGTVSVREVDKLAGERLNLAALRSRYDGMETWSQLILDGLLDTSPAPPGWLGVELVATPAERSAPAQKL